MSAQSSRGRQQRPVTAEDNQKIYLFAHRFARDARDFQLDAALSFHVHMHFNFAFVKPGDERRHHGRDHFFDWLANDSNGSDHDWSANSNLSARAGVEKKLLITFCSRDTAGAHSYDFESQRRRCCNHVLDCLFL